MLDHVSTMVYFHSMVSQHMENHMAADGPEQRRAEFEESLRKGMWDEEQDCDCLDIVQHDDSCRHSPDYDPTPYCLHCGPKSACDCGPIAENN